MPFTPAHPAIVVPLGSWRPRCFVLSALVVGSMSPDFEYFVHLRPLRTIGHDLIGIPLLCVPSGLLVLLAFEFVMKGPLIQLLPGPHRRRLLLYRSPIPFLPSTRLLLILSSLAVGAFSHIAWDAFTHGDGWVVQRFPPLAATLLDLGGRELKVSKVLQYGSTVIGLSLLAYWSWSWLRSQPESAEPVGSPLPHRVRIAVIIILAVVPCGTGLAYALRASSDGLYRMVGHFVVTTISATFLLALAYSTLFRLFVQGRSGIAVECATPMAPTSP